MSDTTSKPNRFGNYIRHMRVESGRSLREVADAIGISHVYLGEVERGVRGPLMESHWDALIAAIPGLARAELKRAAQVSRALEIDLAGARSLSGSRTRARAPIQTPRLVRSGPRATAQGIERR